MTLLRKLSPPWLLLLISVMALWTIAPSAHAERYRLATQNSLNYSGQADRLPAFRTIMRNIHPDMVCMQEITSSNGISQLLSGAFLQIDSDWAAVPFHNGTDTDNGFFYRTSKVQVVATRYIATSLRDIAEYTVRPATGDTTLRLRVYSLHLKANSGSGDNVERRRTEALALRTQLDLLPAGSNLLVCGDYNLLNSDEPAYQLLLAATPSPNGQLWDPINAPGDWDGNSAFAAIHTIGTDGMNARFDFILASTALMDTVGSYVLPATYHAFGNDGEHFGRAINALPNAVVPDSVANALYAASDHLPVVTDVILDTETSTASERPVVSSSYSLLSCYPNPFNPVTTVSYSLPFTGWTTLSIFDLQGREISVLVDGIQSAGNHVQIWNGEAAASGVYFCRLTTGGQTRTARMLLVK